MRAELKKNKDKVRAIILTHGHEDHIGALPYVLKELDVPVYGTRLTLGLVETKLKEHGMLSKVKLVCVKCSDIVKIGNFSVEFIRSNHSIADAVALAIHTPEGVVIQQSPLQYSKINEGDTVNLVVSSGEGSKTTVNIPVDMPTNVDYNVDLTVLVDGKADDSYSNSINPKYNNSYTLSFTGSGSSTVEVLLDGQTYRRYVIDYTTKNYTTTSYNYIPTEPETIYTEPPTTMDTTPIIDTTETVGGEIV